MKDISAEDRNALRILIAAAMFSIKDIPATQTAERVRDAIERLGPAAFGQVIVVPKEDDK